MTVVKYSNINHLLDTNNVAIYPADILFIEPIRYLKYLKSVDKRSSQYMQCPAFTDFFKNTFVFLSPIDITVTFNKDKDMLNISGERGVNQNFYNTFVNARGRQTGENDRYLVTFNMLQLYFYTKEPVMLEMLPNFILYNTNSNFNIIPGQFRVDKWIRPVEFAFEFIDETKPVIIKRGDPLFTIRLTPEKDTKIELERELEVDPLFTRHFIANHTSLKEFIPKLSLKAAYEIAVPLIKLFWKYKDKK